MEGPKIISTLSCRGVRHVAYAAATQAHQPKSINERGGQMVRGVKLELVVMLGDGQEQTSEADKPGKSDVAYGKVESKQANPVILQSSFQKDAL